MTSVPNELQRAHRLGVGDVAPLERDDAVVHAHLERVLLDVGGDRVRRADDAPLQLERLLDVAAQARAAGRQRLDRAVACCLRARAGHPALGEVPVVGRPGRARDPFSLGVRVRDDEVSGAAGERLGHVAVEPARLASVFLAKLAVAGHIPGEACAGVTDEVGAVAARELGVAGAPERRVRMLLRGHLQRHVVEPVELPLVGPAYRWSARRTRISSTSAFRAWASSGRWPQNVCSIAVMPAPDPELEAPSAQVVEHADLLDQPERVVERQDRHQRAEPKLTGMASGGGEEDARRGRHAERSLMMLGQVVAVEPERVGPRQQLQSLLVLLVERKLRLPFQMVEDAELRDHAVLPGSPRRSGLPVFTPRGEHCRSMVHASGECRAGHTSEREHRLRYSSAPLGFGSFGRR